MSLPPAPRVWLSVPASGVQVIMAVFRFFTVALIAVSVVGPAAANEAHARLMSLPEPDRATMLAAAVRSAGDACDRGTRSMYQGSTKSRVALWSVACRDGNAYSVSINPDRGGSTRFLSCTMLRALKAGECFRRYEK